MHMNFGWARFDTQNHQTVQTTARLATCARSELPTLFPTESLTPWSRAYPSSLNSSRMWRHALPHHPVVLHGRMDLTSPHLHTRSSSDSIPRETWSRTPRGLSDPVGYAVTTGRSSYGIRARGEYSWVVELRIITGGLRAARFTVFTPPANSFLTKGSKRERRLEATANALLCSQPSLACLI
jgi:hypothetical protein